MTADEQTALLAENAQLKEALSSRIVLEQAKGVLRERLGLTPEVAFELLRTTARSHRMNIHVLSAKVLRSLATPDEIVRSIAHAPQVLQVMSRDHRAAITQQFYRGVNRTSAQVRGKDSAGVFCECANAHCNLIIDMNRQDLIDLDAAPHYYAMVPGHQLSDLEEIFVERDSYTVARRSLAT